MNDAPWAPWTYLLRLLITVAILRLIAVERTTYASALFAIYLIAMLTMRSFSSPWLLVGWGCLAGGFLLSDRYLGPKAPLVAVMGILLLHALAVPASALWGAGNWETTAGVIMWMGPALLLYIGGSQGVFKFLVPAFLAHAGSIIIHGLTNWHWAVGVLIKEDSLGMGLANNRNLAAGFLAIGIIYMTCHPRLKWLTPPMIIALLFTGSRWGLAVTGAVLLLMILRRQTSWKPLGGALVACVAAVLLLGILTPRGYQIAGYSSFTNAVTRTRAEIPVRLAVPHIPSILPSGIAEHPGLHNVPMRIAVESGIIAAILWVGITLWALRRRNGVVWWVLLTLVALSMLDYYTWMGHLGGFWWLSVGLLVKNQCAIPPSSPPQTPWLAKGSWP